ncbi:MAG TPA: alpha/beta fold hydrolase [Streptosporangiaceae bacterium]|nr:alpha/beta fold hydrolase [Streptosporangiaceae bacterium]
MPRSSLQFQSADGISVAAYRWDPPGTPTPRAAIQLAHGMGEHARRYDKTAAALNEAGFVVYAQDHRGHGATADPARLGDLGTGGWTGLVDDIGLLSARVKSDHPGLPLFLLGHSMGSFALQQYLLDHSGDADGAVLTGTAVIDLLEPALDLDQPLDLAVFNAPFEPARTAFDWLSRDEAVVDAYVADPFCGFGIDQESAKGMFAGARRMADPAEVARIRTSLPVYLAVGDADPVNGGLTLLTPLTERYQAAGLDVTVRVYPGARHEVLNETNSGEIIADLVTWLDAILARPATERAGQT